MILVEEAGEGYQTFTDLRIWQLARKLKLDVYKILQALPVKDLELTNQLKRSVRSVPTNISEGHGRFTFKDQLNFCVIARGSLSETLNHLIDAFDCGYITRDQLSTLKVDIDNLGKALNGYMTFLRQRIPTPKKETGNS